MQGIISGALLVAVFGAIAVAGVVTAARLYRGARLAGAHPPGERGRPSPAPEEPGHD